MVRNITYNIIRILTGLVFAVFGAMKFFPSLTANAPQPTGEALDFMNELTATGYFIPFLGLVEVVIGLMLLFNMWSALASILLMPISVNIFLFNVLLMPSGWFVGVFPLIFNIYLLYYHREKYSQILKK